MRVAFPAEHVGKPPTPGVAIARFCRRRGDVGAPTGVWLQSSGDARLERALLDRRIVAPIDEKADAATVCTTTATIVSRRSSDDAGARAAELGTETMEAQRIGGSINIYPTDAVKIAIHDHGAHQFVVPVRVCVDEGGRVAAVTLLATSGFAGYDMDLVNGVASWRYSPFLFDGKPTPACGLVKFAYRQS